jgi:hypothetical protein
MIMTARPRTAVATDRRMTDDEEMGRRTGNNTGAAASGGAIYGLGIFGAWVYFWQQADTFWEYALAIFQGLFWPAFMVYEAFSALD